MLENGLFGFAVGTEHVDDLVHVELLHFVTGGAAVFAGIEFAGFLGKDLADGCGHCKTAVGVDIDLADSALAGLTKLLFGNTHCIGKFAAILVDDVNIFLRHRR